MTQDRSTLLRAAKSRQLIPGKLENEQHPFPPFKPSAVGPARGRRETPLNTQHKGGGGCGGIARQKKAGTPTHHPLETTPTTRFYSADGDALLLSSPFPLNDRRETTLRVTSSPRDGRNEVKGKTNQPTITNPPRPPKPTPATQQRRSPCRGRGI